MGQRVVLLQWARLCRVQEENVKRKAASAKRKAEAEPEDAAAAAGPSKKPKKKDWWEAEVRGGQPLEDDDDVEYYRQEVRRFAVELKEQGLAQNRMRWPRCFAGFQTAIETCPACIESQNMK